jgi:acyl dehydratase
MTLRVIEGVEELKHLVGQEVGISEWFTVTQSQIDDFARVTGDHQWIHTDAERAKADSPFGSTVAHGFLTLSLLSHLQGQAVHVRGDFKMAINYGLNRVRFTSPVPAGSRIRARSTLRCVEDISGGVQLTWAVTVDIEGSTKPALVAEWLGRLYR